MKTRRRLTEAKIGDRLQFAPPACEVATVLKTHPNGLLLEFPSTKHLEPEWMGFAELNAWGVFLLEEGEEGGRAAFPDEKF